MSWEVRRGKLYYYTARRNGKRVEKWYFGRGPAALMAALEVKNQAESRKAAVQAVRDFDSEMWSLDRSMSLVRTASKQALHSAYYMAGFHRTQCHHWQKTNGGAEVGQKKKRRESRRRRRQKKVSRLTQKAEPENKKPLVADGSGKEQEPIPESATKLDPNQWPLTIDDTLALIRSGRSDLLGHLRWQLTNVPELGAA